MAETFAAAALSLAVALGIISLLSLICRAFRLRSLKQNMIC